MEQPTDNQASGASDRPASWLRTLIAAKAVASALLLFRFLMFALRRRAKYYLHCYSYCSTSCFIAAWAKLTDGKPVDLNSPLGKELNESINYYLLTAFRGHEPANLFEQTILRYPFALTKTTTYDRRKVYRFVLKNRLGSIFKNYRNIANFIALTATKEVATSEINTKLASSSPYWEARVDQKLLPAHLQFKSKAKRLKSRLARECNRQKKTLARLNYLKIDFAYSDLSSLVALSGTLLVLLGYFRIAAICRHFEIPYERYFTITDYLASSISAIHFYVVAAVLAVASWWFFWVRDDKRIFGSSTTV